MKHDNHCEMKECNGWCNCEERHALMDRTALEQNGGAPRNGPADGSEGEILIQSDNVQTFEQPTMNLRWADGVLQQEWLKATVINYVCEKQDCVWRDIPGNPPNDKMSLKKGAER